MEWMMRDYRAADQEACRAIWNRVLEDGVAFPGDKPLSAAELAAYFGEQSAVRCAVNERDEVCGLYVLHPNNIGRCSHVANASYCVSAAARGQGVGGVLVPDSLREARCLGFRGLQFNAVVASNTTAIRLYEKNGFHIVGTIPGGFRLKDGSYSDMYVMYRGLLEE